MALNREAIFAALFQRIEGVSAFKFTSRVFQSWDDTPPSASPAVFMVKGPERSNVRIQGAPPLLELTATVVIYAQNGIDPETPASTILNDVLDALDVALERTPIEGPAPGAMFPANAGGGGQWGTTLGGLVYGCQIEGSTEVFEGVISGWAQAIVPIQILVTKG
jgi:hypothetical protein